MWNGSTCFAMMAQRVLHEQMIHAILKPFTMLWNDSTKCETIQLNVNWFNLMWIDSI
jgi:hypothetical protein